MPSKMSESVSLDVPCPKCGKKTEKNLAWLEAQAAITCRSCGHLIPVAVGDGEAAVMVKNFSDYCNQLDQHGRQLG